MARGRRGGLDPLEVAIRRRRWTFRWWWIVVVLLACMLTFAPQFVAHSSLKETMLAWAIPELNGFISVGDAHLAWWSAPDVRDVTVLDLQQRKLLHVARLSFDRSLWQLLVDPRQLGDIVIVQPDAHVVVQDGTSNVDDILRQFQSRQEGISKDDRAATSFSLRVTDGHLTIVDEISGEVTRLRDIQVRFQPSADDAKMLVGEINGTVDDPDHPGTFSTAWTWHPPAAALGHTLGSGTIQANWANFPCTVWKPVLTRLVPDAKWHGELSGSVEIACTCENQGPVIHTVAQLSLENVQWASPSLMGQDVLADPHMTIQWDGWIDHDYVRVEQFEISSKLAQANMRLEGPMTAWTQRELTSLIWDPTLLRRLECTGTVHVPELTESLRSTLQLHHGVQIREGKIEFQVSADAVAGVRAIHGHVTTNRIMGTAGPQEIAWDEPVSIRWDVAATPQGLQLREARCQSPFLTVQASGNLGHGQVQANAELKQLSEHLQRFVDLNGTQLAGTITCDGGWQSENGRVNGTANGTIQGLHLGFGPRTLREDNVHWRGHWSALVDGTSIHEWVTAGLQAESGEDRIECELTRPIRTSAQIAAWPLHGKFSGSVERWLARLRPWWSPEGYDVRGGLQGEFTGDVRAQSVALAPVHIEFTPLQVASPSLVISETRVVLDGELTWDGPTDLLVAPQWTLSSNSLAARGRDLRIEQFSSQPRLSGQVAYRGDMGRLARYLMPQPTATVLPSGNLEGQGELQVRGNECQYRLVAAVSPFAMTRRQPADPSRPTSTPIWMEDRLTIESDGSYESMEKLLRCQSFRLAGDAMAIAGQGSLRTTDGYVDATGTYEYDLQRLRGKLAWLASGDWIVSGQRRHNFRIQGPLFGRSPAALSPDLRAEFGLGWDELRGPGFAMGPQQITARLERGIVDLAPLEATVYGGRIAVDSRLDLAALPPALVLDAPATMDNLQITPDMFRSWLKYVTPLLADATTAQGTLSVRLNDARIPISDPTMASATGTITIHDAAVQPGPLVQQVVGTVQEVANLTGRDTGLMNRLAGQQNLAGLSNQQVDFQFVQGRVYHRNLQINVGDATVRTEGSVGLDQTLSLLAEIPIQDKWLGNQRLLQVLRGQSLQLPIHGTFNQPQVDRRGVAQLAREAAGGTAERFLQDEVQKGLQKLLGPK